MGECEASVKVIPMKAIPKPVIFFFIGAILSIGTLILYSQYQAEKKWHAEVDMCLRNKTGEILFHSSLGDIKLSEKMTNSFFILMEHPHEVSAHHSSPTNEIRLQINGNEYLLGKDSENTNEYWLCNDMTKKIGAEVISQFKSEEMKAWLTQVKALQVPSQTKTP